MLQVLLSLAVAAGACAISEEQRDSLLAMEWEAFDQGPLGFRSFASGESYCPLALPGTVLRCGKRGCITNTSEPTIRFSHVIGSLIPLA